MLVTIIISRTKKSGCAPSNEVSHLLSEGIEVEWEGVTAGEGMWWLGPLSLVMTGDSVFTVLDDDVAGFKRQIRDINAASSSVWGGFKLTHRGKFFKKRKTGTAK